MKFNVLPRSLAMASRREIDPEELDRIARALRGGGRSRRVARLAFRLCARTGAGIGELAQARVEDFQFDRRGRPTVWVIAAHTTKMRESRTTQLTPAASRIVMTSQLLRAPGEPRLMPLPMGTLAAIGTLPSSGPESTASPGRCAKLVVERWIKTCVHDLTRAARARLVATTLVDVRSLMEHSARQRERRRRSSARAREAEIKKRMIRTAVEQFGAPWAPIASHVLNGTQAAPLAGRAQAG